MIESYVSMSVMKSPLLASSGSGQDATENYFVASKIFHYYCLFCERIAMVNNSQIMFQKIK